MKPFIANIEQETLKNNNFRKVLFTGQHSQLVVMTLEPNEDIGMETHDDVDQFIRIEKGTAKAVLDGQEYDLYDDFAVVIPAGTEHNIINVSATEYLRLYTVYSPANHPEGTVHANKAEADEYEKQEHSH